MLKCCGDGTEEGKGKGKGREEGEKCEDVDQEARSRGRLIGGLKGRASGTRIGGEPESGRAEGWEEGTHPIWLARI